MNLQSNLIKSESPGVYNQIVYTTGYAGRDVRELPALLTALNAILIDIRFMPGDRQIQWKKDYLKLLLKDRYRHIHALGDRADKSTGKVFIHNLALGLRIITELKVNLLLMCECRDASGCHRGKIIEKLKEKGTETREISDWTSPFNGL
ncbi:MAG: hypothetical protein JWN60_2333 [Acidobacteria bacterium]|jgi:uncharacterized protein (DUF488 family)|nr:hypothetical protein [Acidobacteriota bacterium]